MELAALTVPELLQTHGAVLEELRRRQIVRSANNPISDLAEFLFCRTFGWRQEPNSTSGHDARDGDQVRYQIKGRRFTSRNTSRQLGALRNLPAEPFDWLAGIIFSPDYRVHRAALVPYALVRERARLSGHTNSWIFHLRDDVWNVPGVRDVTPPLRATASLL